MPAERSWAEQQLPCKAACYEAVILSHTRLSASVDVRSAQGSDTDMGVTDV